MERILRITATVQPRKESPTVTITPTKPQPKASGTNLDHTGKWYFFSEKYFSGNAFSYPKNKIIKFGSDQPQENLMATDPTFLKFFIPVCFRNFII
jgi:hypothetical protein